MARPKGSKNKVTPPPEVAASGNPMFNLKDALPVEMASSAVTAEDLAFDAELERLSMEEMLPDIDPDLAQTLTKEKAPTEHLREHVDGEYREAKTLNELEQQISIAKRLGCDSIDASPQVIQHYCGKGYSRSLGFFMYKDIKVHFSEEYEASLARSKVTVEQKLFGNSKVK